MRALTAAEQCAARLVYGTKEQEPLPISSLGREARLRAEDARQALGAQTAREDAVYARAYRKGFYHGSGGTTALPSEVEAAHERWVENGRKTHLEEEP